ncbi:MAG: hypothetical protein RXP97_04935 [Nitrososphaeria archaeon]
MAPWSCPQDACSGCGWIDVDQRSAAFRCGLAIDVQLDAAIDLHLRMDGGSH